MRRWTSSTMIYVGFSSISLVLHHDVAEIASVLKGRGNKIRRDGLVQHELVHDTMRFACLLFSTVASIDRPNDIPVHQLLQLFIGRLLVSAFSLTLYVSFG